MLPPVHSTGNRRVYFTQDVSITQPSTRHALPEEIGDVFRAYVVHLCGTSQNVGHLAGVAGALRRFWIVVCDRRPAVIAEGAAAFRWDTLSSVDLVEFERRLHSAGYVVEPFMEAASDFVDFLQNPARGIVPAWRYQVTPSTRNRHRRRSPEERREWSRTRLPPREALLELAELYWRTRPEAGPNQDDPRAIEDRLMLCAAAILLCTGLRISELCMLGADCPGQEVGPDGVKQFVRFAALKTKWVRPAPRIRWLSPRAARLFREAYHEIIAITEPWREAARRLEADPDAVGVPNGQGGFRNGDELITRREAKMLLNLGAGLHTYRPDLRAAIPSRGREGALYRIADVAREIQQERKKEGLGTVVLHRRGGKPDQLLSETLFIVPLQFLTKRSHHRLLVRSLQPQHVAGWLGGAGGYRCVFDPAEGGTARRTRLRTHQFRHLVNYLARKRGMSEALITIWMQRASLKQTEAYMGDAPSDVAASVLRQGIRSGEFDGPFVDHLKLLPSAARNEVLEAEVQAAHQTTVGWCKANFAYDPCQYYGRCIGCRHALVQRGDQTALVQIQGMRRKDEAQLARFDAEAHAGEYVSPEYRARLAEQVTGARDMEARILSGPADGEWVRAFPEGEDRFTDFDPEDR
jgi:hypothetical protein